MSTALQQAPKRNDLGREYTLSDKDFASIAKFVKTEAGINLTEAKRDLVYSRLVKRLRALQLEGFGTYIDLVASPEGASERSELISAITTNVTNFYREPHHFDHLRSVAVPDMVKRMAAGEPGRIWSAGCSDGREPYTIACTVLEAMPDAAKRNFKILASDIDHKSLASAKAGRYNAEMASKMPKNVHDKFFVRSANGVEAGREISELIAFRYLNLLTEWPFKQKFDIIFCRNVLIYFEPDLQAQLIARFCSVLKPDGYLYIGHSERASGPALQHLEQVGVTTYHHIPAGGRK
ncbi:CheR family methyltransferase [Oricola cellulosilytica]|uniref:Chemotaxis protein methyltransferase n=1 Tax=Oricola cellulosilytica TaxID=1429082 RepID=A0A4R0PEK3_9HYPH|nr:protein-glutamate O-methyltransferase [Oricola cellulosilytica]TCD16237.1 methyltransferase domain-containing protein [Oricola cellulosilytica]